MNRGSEPGIQVLWNSSMGIMYTISLLKHKHNIAYLSITKDKPKSKKKSGFSRLNKIILLCILNVRPSTIWKYSIKLLLPNRHLWIFTVRKIVVLFPPPELPFWPWPCQSFSWLKLILDESRNKLNIEIKSLQSPYYFCGCDNRMWEKKAKGFLSWL